MEKFPLSNISFNACVSKLPIAQKRASSSTNGPSSDRLVAGFVGNAQTRVLLDATVSLLISLSLGFQVKP